MTRSLMSLFQTWPQIERRTLIVLLTLLLLTSVVITCPWGETAAPREGQLWRRFSVGLIPFTLFVSVKRF